MKMIRKCDQCGHLLKNDRTFKAHQKKFGHKQNPEGVSLDDSGKKIAELSDVVKAKDTEIAQLQDSLTKSDAAFLEVTAELAKLNDRPISDGMILDFINNRLDEDTWAKIGTIKKFGMAPVEDSKKKDSTQDRAEAARDAHNVEVVGSSPAPATNSELTAPVADVIPEESPGEKWWREFQANLNK
jgi:hypothetical protein